MHQKFMVMIKLFLICCWKLNYLVLIILIQKQCSLFTYKLIIPSFEILIVWIASSISPSCYWYWWLGVSLAPIFKAVMSCKYCVWSAQPAQPRCCIGVGGSSGSSEAPTLYTSTRLQSATSGRAGCVCVLLIGTQQQACKQWWTIDSQINSTIDIDSRYYSET